MRVFIKEFQTIVGLHDAECRWKRTPLPRNECYHIELLEASKNSLKDPAPKYRQQDFSHRALKGSNGGLDRPAQVSIAAHDRSPSWLRGSVIQ
jgi:hypothetical protein